MWLRPDCKHCEPRKLLFTQELKPGLGQSSDCSLVLVHLRCFGCILISVTYEVMQLTEVRNRFSLCLEESVYSRGQAPFREREKGWELQRSRECYVRNA